MSTPENPYEAPKSDISTSTGGAPLASPWLRLGAAIVDGIVLFPVNYLLAKILLNQPSIDELMEAGKKGQDAVDAIMPSKGMQLLGQIIGIVVFVAVNFVFLKKGQTIGKKVLKLQIQNRTDGSLLSLQDLIAKRIVPLYIAGALGSAIHWSLGLIVLVDALCIFRSGRNTLHDDLANTKVVKLPG